MSERQSEFRPEIAGLRAIAVVAVVLCHLKVSGFAGGFVGVDIFFVISGYLITKHILGDIGRDSFSFLDFYLRRFRRILPALISVLIVTYIVGFAWLPPDLLRGLGKEATHALLSIANIQYWREAREYFAPTSEQLPLLHTWSLSLEEQFYAVWPAFLVLAARFRLTGLFIAASGLASFLFMVAGSDAQAAFFLMPFRVFEFCIGAGALYLQPRVTGRVLAEVLGLSGLAAVVVSVFVAQEVDWPSWITLLPCLGTASLIAGGSHTAAARSISSAVFRGIGAISYSLYLVHWPIIFFVLFVLGPGTITAPVSVLLLTVMILLAWANYHWVERPFRALTFAAIGAQRRQLLRYVGLIACLVVGTHLTFMNKGFPWRLSPSQAEIAKLQSYGMNPCTEIARRHCAFGEVGAKTKLELVGDSFAHQYVAAFDPLLKRAGLQGETATLGGCPALLGMSLQGSRLEECRQYRDRLLARLAASDVDIVFAQAWDVYLDSNTLTDFPRTQLQAGEQRSLGQLQASLEATFELLLQNNRKILLIGAQVRIPCHVDRTRLQPAPLWYAPNPACPEVTLADVKKAGSAINQMLQRVQAKWPDRVTLFRPEEHLCTTACPSMSDGIWLYEDSGHFTVAGARYLAARAADILDRFVGRARTSDRGLSIGTEPPQRRGWPSYRHLAG